MGFARDRAIAHRARFEALEDVFDRLYFLDRHSGALFEAEETAQGEMLLGLLVDETGVGLESIVVAGAHCALQGVNDLRAEKVSFAFGTPLVFTADFQSISAT